MSETEKELLDAIRDIHKQTGKGNADKAMDVIGNITWTIVNKYKSK